MDMNRDLWADAYRFYQQQSQRLENSRNNLPGFFCNLAEEIVDRSAGASREAKYLWVAVYLMLGERVK